MRLEQLFEVAAPPEAVWEALIDIERVTPCLPGAAIIARNGDGSYDGEFTVKIGPTSAVYSGRLSLQDVDAETRRLTMHAAGTDRRGQGGAKTTIVSTVTPSGAGSRVEISSDYQITGRLARFGRGGMIEEISARLVARFGENLQQQLDADGAPAPDGAAGSAGAPAPAPDAVIEGALPVADGLAGEPETPSPQPAVTEPPTAEPAAPEPAAPESAATESAATEPAPAEPRPADPAAWEPAPDAALDRPSATQRVKDNAAPFAALVAGFLLALRVLRRRS